jgi:hypothetical protein
MDAEGEEDVPPLVLKEGSGGKPTVIFHGLAAQVQLKVEERREEKKAKSRQPQPRQDPFGLAGSTRIKDPVRQLIYHTQPPLPPPQQDSDNQQERLWQREHIRQQKQLRQQKKNAPGRTLGGAAWRAVWGV